ncbi:Tumor necrosis factor receptor superfamily member 12A, partial [Eschrichtius robustus]|nr:Tumor necrosis factor receptor superfamily member 12A [Eschrichtius robustus]
MDCASCPTRPHSDFCLGCAAAPPASFRLLWPILGGALSLALVLGLLSGFLVWRRCRRREKFTTPIEETGGEGCPGVALIQIEKETVAGSCQTADTKEPQHLHKGPPTPTMAWGPG